MKRLRPHLKYMLGELESNCLEVQLVPSRDYETAIRGGCIRVAIQQNAQWYQTLCKRFSARRTRKTLKHDTLLKRRNVLSTLRTLIKGGKTNSYLVPFLVKEAQRLHDEYKADNSVPF